MTPGTSGPSQNPTNPARSRRPGPDLASGFGLRAFHLIIFLGFGAGAIAGMFPELRQLFSGLAHAWHSGTPPSLPGTLSAVAALALGAGLIFFLVRGRSAPLWMSIAMLAAFCVSYWQQDYPFSRRSSPGANLAMFEMGKALHEKMRTRLQQTGAVPNTSAEWEAALASLSAERAELPSPFRTRSFRQVPWSLRTLTKEGDFLADAVPGTFTVFIPADASRFTITMVGLDPEHQPVRLRDDQGNPFELKGAYTPDTRN